MNKDTNEIAHDRNGASPDNTGHRNTLQNSSPRWPDVGDQYQQHGNGLTKFCLVVSSLFGEYGKSENDGVNHDGGCISTLLRHMNCFGVISRVDRWGKLSQRGRSAHDGYRFRLRPGSRGGCGRSTHAARGLRKGTQSGHVEHHAPRQISAGLILGPQIIRALPT
jgi:hypothetical protein